MRFEKPVLTLKEFAMEEGMHVNTLKRYVLAKGKCRFKQNGPRGRITFKREWVDEFQRSETKGGSAYGKDSRETKK